MGGIPYSYMYIPCLEVGGDLPDVYELNGQTYGVISDVSGKGVSAGMLSAFVKAGFDHKEPSLSKAVEKLSGKFVELNLDERSYITLAAVRISKAEGKLRFLTAGHNAPILLKSGHNMHHRAIKAFESAGFSPNVPFLVDQMNISYALSESGMGLCFVTDTFVHYSHPKESICLYNISEEHGCRTLFIVRKKNKYCTHAMREFIRIAQEVMATS